MGCVFLYFSWKLRIFLLDQPCRIEFREISDHMMGQPLKIGGRCGVAYCDDAAGAVLSGLLDRGQAVLNDHAVREIHPQPPSGLQVHRALVGISAVIIYNILFPEPPV